MKKLALTLNPAPAGKSLHVALTAALVLGMVSCSSTPDTGTSSETTPAANAPTSSDIYVSEGNMQPLALITGSNDLSAQTWVSQVNGYGPAEINRSNGQAGVNDGKTITLNGTKYSKGLGVHANSTLTYALGGICQSMTASIGIDDEVASNGTVIFQVFADGTKLYDSGKMTGKSTTKTLKVDLTGRKELKLVVTNAGDNNNYDHADWANPVLNCTVPTTATAPAPAPAPAPVPTPAPTVYSAPIVITAGGTYTGNWESNDPTVPAITIKTSAPVIIENCNIRSKGHLIQASWVKANLTVRNCKGQGLNPNVTTRIPGRFVHAEGVVSLLIENNTFDKTSGIYIYRYAGPSTTVNPITIRRNVATNLEGRYSDGAGGYQQSFYRIQFVQLNNVVAVPGVDISWNKVLNTPRQSHVEDVINFHSSTGTATNPMVVHDNLISGAYSGNPSASYSGGGIMLGDGGGQFQQAVGNTVLETSNYGVAVASGDDMLIEGNTVLGTGKLADGTFLDADPDAGIYIRDYQQNPAHRADSVVARNNTVGWGRPNATNPDKRWDLGINTAAGVGINNTQIQITNKAIDPTLLTTAISNWESRAQAAGMTPGAK